VHLMYQSCDIWADRGYFQLFMQNTALKGIVLLMI
jgi:hypothetical protein